jgi:two-component system nitrate/nitrite response regulator NarL
MHASAPPGRPPIRVFVLTEIRLYGESVAQFLAGHQGIELVGVESRRELVRGRLRALQPDIIVADVRMEDAPRALQATTALPGKVVAIGIAEVEQDVVACAEAGIAGYVPRNGTLCDLLATIESVAADEMPCHPRIAASLARRVAELASDRAAGHGPAQLTLREEEIVKLIDDGLSNKEIARRLSIEPSTVKNHVHNILEKLGTHRRGEAAARFRNLARTARI